MNKPHKVGQNFVRSELKGSELKGREGRREDISAKEVGTFYQVVAS